MFNRKAKVAQSGTAPALTQHGKGIIKGNPKRCLFCLKPVRQGDPWTKHTSKDREYSIIVHDRCNGKS